MAIEKLADGVVNEVATNLEEVAEVTRRINSAGLGYFVVGLGFGAAVGFYFGHKFNREKLRLEAWDEAAAEVAVLRQAYIERMLNSTDTEPEDTEPENNEVKGTTVIEEKPPIEQVVEKLGYAIPDRERPLPPPVPISGSGNSSLEFTSTVSNASTIDVRDLPPDVLDDLPEDPVETSKSMNAGWNYEQELRKRSPEVPYIIHQNEFNHSNAHYSKGTCTYYELDDVLVDDETERPLLDGDIIVGEDNLQFGHGSDDINVVYVRNDRLERDMVISRVHRSYEEDVLGLNGGSMEDDNDDDTDDS